MALSDEEIDKVNGLYKQLDQLTAENQMLKKEITSNFDAVNDKLDSLSDLVKDLAGKCEV